AALVGVWVQKDGEMKIEFADKDVMKLFPHGDNEVIIIVCSYALEKDQLVKAKITDLEGKAKEKAKELLAPGLKFSFTWQVKNDTATLADVKSKDVELLKSHLEGKYEQKK